MAELWQYRVPLTLIINLPTCLIFVFVPLGLLGLRNLKRWVVLTPPIVMLTLYLPHVFYLSHYPSVIIAGTVALALLGVQHFCREVLTGLPLLEPFITTTVFVSAVAAMTPFSLIDGMEFSTAQYINVNFTYERLPIIVQKPASVFSRYRSGQNSPMDEPVYNNTTVRIDDAKIVMAQWLGDHNIALIHYYHDLGQNRHVYVLDRSKAHLDDMGTIDDILDHPTVSNSENGMATTQP